MYVQAWFFRCPCPSSPPPVRTTKLTDLVQVSPPPKTVCFVQRLRPLNVGNVSGVWPQLDKGSRVHVLTSLCSVYTIGLCTCL